MSYLNEFTFRRIIQRLLEADRPRPKFDHVNPRRDLSAQRADALAQRVAGVPAPLNRAQIRAKRKRQIDFGDTPSDGYRAADFEKDKADLQKLISNMFKGDVNSSGTNKSAPVDNGDQIINILRREFGIKLSKSEFKYFDVAAKLRWFVLAYLSERDAKFLERTVDNYIEELFAGADDEESLDEIEELRAELIENPAVSQRFIEYLHKEAQETISEMNPEQFEIFADLVQYAFSDIPGGMINVKDGDGFVAKKLLKKKARY